MAGRDWAVMLVGAGIGVAGTLFAGWYFQEPDRPEPPELTITTPDTDGGTPQISGEARLEGTARDLGPGQTIWAFDSPIGSSAVYPHGPCPANDKGEWKCGGFLIGESKDVGREFILYAAIVDDGDVGDMVSRLQDLAKGSARPYPGSEPPNVTYESVTVEKIAP